jgi:hypothetical protein
MAETPSPSPSPGKSKDSEGSWFRHDLKVSKDAEEWLRGLSPDLFKNYESIEKLWNHPLTQFGLTLGKDAEFKAGIQKMAREEAGARLIGFELFLILVLWVVRAWRLGKASTWLTRFWTQAWVGGLYWLSALFLVPALVYGEGFRITLAQLIRAAIRHFFA